MEQIDWDKTELNIYLLFDFWQAEKGLAVLAGQHTKMSKWLVIGDSEVKYSEKTRHLDSGFFMPISILLLTFYLLWFLLAGGKSSGKAL